MKSIAILEFVCGGGFAEQALQDIPSGLLKEGRAMLEAVADDWSRLPDWQVRVAWDRRIGDWTLPLIDVVETKSGPEYNRLESWWSIASQVDRVLVIAPEIDGRLAEALSYLRRRAGERMEPDAHQADAGLAFKTDRRLATPCFLNADQAFIEATSDKWLTARYLRQASIRHPETQLLSRVVAGEALPMSTSSAWIVKPRDGAGCEEIRLYRSEADLKQYLSTCASEPERTKNFLIQPWLPGEPGSIVVLCSRENKRRVLPAMTQRFEYARVSNFETMTYQGGVGPWSPVDAAELDVFARKVIDALPGRPLGWIGIDFSVVETTGGTKELVAIEVNPRLTTSYLGLRKIVRENLAELISS